MTTQEKRKYIAEYCNWRGQSDQCNGCPVADMRNCQFNVLDSDTIDIMYEKIRKDLE